MTTVDVELNGGRNEESGSGPVMDARQEAWVAAALERHGPALIRYAASLTGSEDAGRDVVQDVFVRLIAETPERLEGRLAGWLFTVCRNRSLDILRRQKRMSPLAQGEWEQVPAEVPGPDGMAERQETLGLALGLLRNLGPREQEVVRLKFQGGLSYEEIGRVLDLSPGNVGFILHSALKTLRQGLRRCL